MAAMALFFFGIVRNAFHVPLNGPRWAQVLPCHQEITEGLGQDDWAGFWVAEYGEIRSVPVHAVCILVICNCMI